MKETPWRMPVKKAGSSLQNISFRYDPAWIQAIREVAKQIDGQHKQKISMATVIQDLSSRNGTYFAEVRRQVNERYKQLKREKANEQNNTVTRRD